MLLLLWGISVCLRLRNPQVLPIFLTKRRTEQALVNNYNKTMKDEHNQFLLNKKYAIHYEFNI